MTLGDLGKNAEKFMKDNSDKVQSAMKSEKAEEISDKLLDGAAGAANKLTGGKHSEKISEVRDNLDGKIGNE